MMQEVQVNNDENRVRYYVVVGANGFAVVDGEQNLVEAMHKLIGIMIWEFTDPRNAITYGTYMYGNRCFARMCQTGQLNKMPMVPCGLPLNQLYIDPDCQSAVAVLTPPETYMQGGRV